MSMVGSRIRALRRVALASTVLVALASATATAADRTYSFNFSQISLSEALRAYAKITGQQIIFTEDLVSGRAAPVLKGAYTAEDALAELLSNTGLVVERSPSGAIMVRRVAAQAAPPSSTAQGPAASQVPDAPKDTPKDDEKKAEDDRKVERVVVTGTHIRGKHPKSSPLDIYTAKDIERSGATTTEQFIQKLPQNMATRSQYAAGAIGAGDRINQDSVAGVDLRGLGLGTTLVLMNGRRLGLADFGRTADVSMIPVSAIERVEVLTDGASAIYGSDAVGGVVNFVLRKDFDGAETRLSYGGVSSGNLQHGDFTQTFGRAWDSGNVLVSYFASSASDLKVADRGYAAGAQLGDLTPIDQRQNLLVTFAQDITQGLSISGDAIFSQRDQKREDSDVSFPPFESLTTVSSSTDQYFGSLALDYEFSPKLHGSFTATYGKTEVDEGRLSNFYNVPSVSFRRDEKNYSALDLTAMLDGTLFALPGGDVRFSVGGGVFDEDYFGNLPNASTRTPGTLARRTGYVFGELFLPVIGAEQNVPLAHRLELTMAARYTRYEDQSDPTLDQEFGDGIDPKFGVLWAPAEALAFRATYGTSFRAPGLIELDESRRRLAIRTGIPIPSSGGPSATTITPQLWPIEDLRPETASTYTVGFDVRPTSFPGLRLSGTYYNISYEDRIAVAPTGDELAHPELHPTTIYHPASAALIEDLIRSASRIDVFGSPVGINLSDPAATAQVLFARLPNVWIRDLRTRNLALSEQDGFDFSISNSFTMDWAEMRYGASITRILSYRQQTAANEPVVSVADIVTRPVDLRGRAYVGFSRGGLDGTLSVNYVDDYKNDANSSQGAAPIDSWTTLDLNLSYAFDDTASGLLDGLQLSLSMQNVFDEDPPFVASSLFAVASPVGFDPANANPLGRLVVVGLTKRW